MPYFYGAPELKPPAGSRGFAKVTTKVLVNPTIGVEHPKKTSPGKRKARAVVYGTDYHGDGFLTVRRRREQRASMHRWS